MKVFFAVLLFIGFAPARPDPNSTINDLQTELEQDIQNIEQDTKESLVQIDTNVIKNLANDNIVLGSIGLVKDFSNDVNNMMKLLVPDIEQLLQDLQKGIDDEQQNITVVPILEDLAKQLEGNMADMKLSVSTLLKEILNRFVYSIISIISAPQSTTDVIEDNFNTDLNLITSEGQIYLAFIAEEIQDAFQKIYEELDK